MKIFTSTILAILFVTAVLGDDPTNSTTTIEPTTVTTLQTTTEPDTTTLPTTTSSTSTTITSTIAPTTTASPTTTVSPTTASSTSEAPVTTKAPEPTPPTPDDTTWNITQNNVTCIRAQLKAYFKIPFEDKVEYIALTQKADDSQSNCDLSNDTQVLILTDASYTLTMLFVKEGDKVYVNETTFKYTLPEGKGSGTSDLKMCIAKVGNSYLCKSETDVKLGNITMDLSYVQIQAFGEQGNTNFGSAEECEADDKVSDAVPIAVGCALAALIIVVLIAYLVGRRRSRQRGYQSV